MTSYLESIDYNVSAVSAAANNVSQVECQRGYDFSKDEYTSTITSDFELVCANKYWRSTSRSVFFSGRLFGAIVFGQLSDRFGRRPTFLIGVLSLLIAGVIASVAPNMFVFVPMYFLQGAAHTGAFLVAFTVSTELVGPRYRVVSGFVIQIFYGLGYVGLAGLAYFIREWRYLELAITLPAVLFGAYWWLLPESIPWLLSRGRDAEAEVIIRQAAKHNKVTLEEEFMEKLKEGAQRKSGERNYYFYDCLRTVHMATMSLNVWFNWLVNSLVFYGISINTENMAGDPYLNFGMIGGVGILAYVLCLVVVNRTGRRLSLVVSMCVGGAALIVAGLLFTNLDETSKICVQVFTMCGKFCITASYAIVYLMAAELFPTVVRNVGMGVASMSARVGGIFVPYILELKDVWGSLPLLVFGILAIVSGLLALFLPETTKRPLPQTFDDVKDRNHGLQCRWLRKSKTHDVTSDKEQEMTSPGSKGAADHNAPQKVASTEKWQLLRES
ncbi:organic cation transporter protein-like [Physella acuta]|uniref:organic cation transporter protein-like n=1 Tax=Physella acuta TaxID=109671 RepID=UPI0027DB7630|nr:organic cation transporter protein-like [Physella acuta]